MYARHIIPKFSDDAIVVLSEYYIAAAIKIGSPRLRETIFKTAFLIARLKLKQIVDADEARKACQFYNVMLNEYGQVVNVPANPRDVTLQECLYRLEALQAPIAFEELVLKVQEKDEYIKNYLGKNLRIRENKKLRQILLQILLALGGDTGGKRSLHDAEGNESILLDGIKGDILLNGADYAEEFDN